MVQNESSAGAPVASNFIPPMIPMTHLWRPIFPSLIAPMCPMCTWGFEIPSLHPISIESASNQGAQVEYGSADAFRQGNALPQRNTTRARLLAPRSLKG